MEKKWEVVIGLEIHAQLNTKTKLFCSCSTQFGNLPNQNTCEVCLGHPGVLPVLNEAAIAKAVRVGLAIQSEVNRFSQFERKNYFYPDLPKAYQITQLSHPICTGGGLEIQVKEKSGLPLKKFIRINRVQLEEDAGKLVHSEGALMKESYVDLNRAGTPLIEIVSEPDLSSPEEAVDYFKTLRNLLLYLEVCDGNMQEGSLRCDANVSIRPQGDPHLGTRTEIKNMNTFKGIQAAINYEIKRQTSLKTEGGVVAQQTLLFDDEKGETRPMRNKEEAQDYRYFPDPDLTPIKLEDSFINKIEEGMPELPKEKQERFKRDYSLSDYDTWLLVNDKALANYFETAVKVVPNQPKKICNWISSEVLSTLNHQSITIKEFPIPPKHLGEIVQLQEQGVISGKIGKEIFHEMLSQSKSPRQIIEEKNLSLVSDQEEIKQIIEKIIVANPEASKKYRLGQVKVFGFFVGQIMKVTKGQADPSVVNRLLKQQLESPST